MISKYTLNRDKKSAFNLIWLWLHISPEKLSQGDKALSYGRWGNFGYIVTPTPCVYDLYLTIYTSKSIKLQVHDTYIIRIRKYKIGFYVVFGEFSLFDVPLNLNKMMHLIIYDMCICQFKNG